MPQLVCLRGAILLLLVATIWSSTAGKVLHTKSSGGELNSYEDKLSSSRSISKRSVDMLEVKDHIDDTRLPRDVVPTAYRLDLHPFPADGHFTGRVCIEILCNEPTNTITLHAHENLQIAHSEVTVKQLEPRNNTSKPKDPNVKPDYPFNHKGYEHTVTGVPLTISSTKKEPAKQWYVITLADTLKKGMAYHLDISFSGSMSSDSTQGFFRSSYQLHRTKEERWFAATRMSPTNARRVFPCFDEPEFKTPFQLNVAQPDRLIALSDMHREDKVDKMNETGWKMVHFMRTPPISTFSVGIAVLDLESVTIAGMPLSEEFLSVSVFARPSILSLEVGETIIDKISATVKFLERYLNSPFSNQRLNVAALPHFSDPEPADHFGLLIMKESECLNNDTLSWRMASELAQHWLGHLVTPAWWCGAMINKALANHIATLVIQQDRENWNSAISYSLFYEYGKRHPYASLGSQEEYLKIARTQWLFRMLDYTLTPKTFRDGIRNLVKEHKFSTYRVEDLWAALTKQARKDQTLPESITVEQIADSWITKDRFPVITVTRDYQDNSANVEQHVFLRERPQDVRERDSMLWYIPLMYLTPSRLDPNSLSEPVVWMKEEKHASLINLPGPDDFIIVNPDEIGMFMVNYDQTNWALLSEYLHGPGPSLPPVTRAKLLHDAWNLAYGGELDMRTALNMTLFLEQETDLKVWEVMFTMIDHLGRRVDGTDAGLKFEKYARFLLTRLSDSLGEPQQNECSKKTKLRLLTWDMLSQLGHQPCVTKAREAYSAWMESDDPDEGNPVRDSNLCTVFRWGTIEEWEFGLQRVIHFPASRKQSERTYLLKTLAGCPRQEEKVERILDITLMECNDNFTDSDVRLVLNSLAGGATGYTTLFNFLSQNWNEIKLRLNGKAHLWEYLVHRATGMFNTQEGLNMVSELYVTRQGEFGSAEPIVEQALRTINAEAQWSEQNLPAMEVWLDGHLPGDGDTSTVAPEKFAEMYATWLQCAAILLTCITVSSHVVNKRRIDIMEAKARLDDYRLPRNVLPVGYHLELIPYPGEGHFRGHVHMNITCQEPTHTIVLHAYEHLRVVHQQVTVKQIRGPPRRILLETSANNLYEGNSLLVPELNEPLPISSISRDANKERFSITLLEELEKGATYQVDLEFYGALDSENSEGFFRGSYEDSETERISWYAATKMSPSNARRIFPCFDEPSFKAPFRISVARYTGMSTLSNMPLHAIEITDEQGWVWDHFPPTPPISTFSVGFIISDLKTHKPFTMPSPRGGVTIRFHGTAEFLSSIEGSLRIATRMVEYLEEYLAVRYPLPKLDIVALPEYKCRRPADHLGLIMFQEDELTGEAGQSHLIHELVHQWLTHVVTPHWWSDLYITTALGRYLATAGLLKLLDKENWAPTLQHSVYYEFSSQSPYYRTPDFKHNSITNRAVWFLRMLNSVLTETTFRTALTGFLLNNQYSTFTEDEFWATLTHQAQLDGTLQKSMSVGRIARSWLRKDCSRFPVVTIKRNYNENTATISQHVFIREQPHTLTEEEQDLLWWIPIMYLTPDSLDPSAVRPVAWMKEEKVLNITNLPDAQSFIIVNPTDAGMFMVNYDHHNWGLLAQYLQGSRLNVPVATRIKLLHDAWNLALGGELDFETALDMTLFLLNETEASIWDVMFTMIGHTSHHIRRTRVEAKFNEYLRRLMTPMYESLGEPVASESVVDTEFRLNAKAVICGAGYQLCIDEARESLSMVLPTLEADSNDTESLNGLLCPDVMWNGTEDWATPALQLVQFLANRSFLERTYLMKQMDACPGYDDMVERILNGTIEESNATLSDADWQMLINFIVGSSAGHEMLFSFLSDNFNELKDRFEDSPDTWHYILAAATKYFRTKEGLDMISEFYARYSRKLGRAVSIVEDAMKDVNEEIAWSKANLQDIEYWLDSILPHFDDFVD